MTDETPLERFGRITVENARARAILSLYVRVHEEHGDSASPEREAALLDIVRHAREELARPPVSVSARRMDPSRPAARKFTTGLRRLHDGRK